MLFAFVAGAGTALSPCVLPILPALLSAGATGGRRRPLGIVLGLALTFTITIAGAAELVDGVGLGDGTLRSLAMLVLLGFGLLLLAPPLAARLEGVLSRLVRFGPRSRGDGFVSGLGVGAALGFVYAPCAGPILAAVISVSAASGNTVAVAIAYAAGSAAALFVLCVGGRRVPSPRARAVVQRVMGAVMVATALAVLVDADLRFQTAIADELPAVVVNPTSGSSARTRSSGAWPTCAGARGSRTEAAGLPRLGAAPDFAGIARWHNSPPLSLEALRGRVVLIDFWTYTCINCIRTLPYLRAWDDRYRDRGLIIVGVHTPEFEFEKDAGNVRDAIARSRLRYAVAQDNDYGTWDAWGNQYWPAKYLIDAEARSATPTSARVTTRSPRRRSATCSRRRDRPASASAPGARPPRRCPATRPPRPTSAPLAPSAGSGPAARRARVSRSRRHAAARHLRPRRHLEGRRRVGRGRARGDGEGARHRQVRLPRARLARQPAPHGHGAARRRAVPDRDRATPAPLHARQAAPTRGARAGARVRARASPASRSRSARRRRPARTSSRAASR